MADDPGLITTIEITGDNPLTGVQINGENPTTGVFIDGNNPTTLVDIDGTGSTLYINGHDINQTISSAVSGAVQQATPNSQWSSASTGTLPPLAIVPEINTLAPGKYNNAVAGNEGYFSIKTNMDPFVYKGAGCGVWGISEGYPDLWSRRQLAGITIDYTIQKERLAQTQVALVKAIGEIQNNSASTESINARLSDSLDNLSAVTTDLSVMEQEGLIYRAQIAKQFDDVNLKFNILLIACGLILALSVLFGIILFSKSRKKI